MTTIDLFGFEQPEIKPLPPGKKYDSHGNIRGKHYVEPKGYAGTPGTGKEGETCKGCEHYASVGYHNKTYPKCLLMKYVWTHGRGSDILASSPACEKWEQAHDN